MSSSEQGRLEIQPWRPVPLPAAAIALAQSLDEGEAYVIQAGALAQKSKSNSALGVTYFNEGRLLERNADDDRALKAFKRPHRPTAPSMTTPGLRVHRADKPHSAFAWVAPRF